MILFKSIISHLLLLTLILYQEVYPECISKPNNTRYILDSLLYSNTIPGFQLFDLDAIIYNITYAHPVSMEQISAMDSFQCRTVTSATCGPAYACCLSSGVPTTVDMNTESNWLVSDYYVTDATIIDVQVLCEEILGSPVPDCRNSSKIYFYESDNELTITSVTLSEFTLAETSINTQTNDGIIHASFDNTKKGFYIGIVNHGTCAQISTVQIYYLFCPAMSINQFHSVPDIPVPILSDEPTILNFTCSVGSVSLQQAECYTNGSWSLPESVECVCVRGWSQVSNLSCVACPENTYKPAVGNESECMSCGEMSSTNGRIGSESCECDAGWYRSEEESVDMLCGRSPSIVRNLGLERVDNGGGVSIVVSWNEPVDVWNRSVSYNVSLYLEREGSVELWWSDEIENTLYELSESELETSSREYLLVVTSLNNLVALSEVEKSVSVRFVSTFPEVLEESLSLNESSSVVEWEYRLEGGVSNLSFELNYTSIGGVLRQVIVNGCSVVTTGVYRCRAGVFDLDESMSVVISLIPLSPNVTGGILSQNFTFIIPTTNTSIAPLVVISVIVPIVIILLLVFVVVLGVLTALYFCRRKHKYVSGYSTDERSYPMEKLYQDPSLYNDLNTAVRRFAKEINHEDLELKENIGEGEFAEVCKGILKKQDQRIVVAIKVLKSDATKKNKEDFFGEASIMGQFKHPNVIFLYGVTLARPIVIVTPFIENGSLDDFVMKKESSITAIQQVRICIGVACGMEYFTKIGFVHRDLAARNVLIDSDWTPKISDFGLSRETEENFYNVKSGGKIPVRWTAPEAIAYRKFNEASDMWSFGVLMWEVTSFGRIPYAGIENYDVLGEVQAGYRLEKPDFCPHPLYDLMMSCWKSDAKLRPTFTEIQYKLYTLIDNNFGLKRENRASVFHAKTCSLEDWLDSIGFSRYISHFQEGGYCYLAQIYSLTHEDLIKLGIVPTGHRSKIMKSIAEMHKTMLQTVN